MVANLVRAARAYMTGKRGKRVKVGADTMLSRTRAEDAAKQERWLSTEAKARVTPTLTSWRRKLPAV